MVAVDTPDNLTHQLKGSASLYVQVEGSTNALDTLHAIAGVRRVTVATSTAEFTGYEIESRAEA